MTSEVHARLLISQDIVGPWKNQDWLKFDTLEAWCPVFQWMKCTLRLRGESRSSFLDPGRSHIYPLIRQRFRKGATTKATQHIISKERGAGETKRNTRINITSTSNAIRGRRTSKRVPFNVLRGVFFCEGFRVIDSSNRQLIECLRGTAAARHAMLSLKKSRRCVDGRGEWRDACIAANSESLPCNLTAGDAKLQSTTCVTSSR
ncbi:hypothetical protein SCHPADRAFT_894878 [Schizopora paradoxa]|uniref:Uncharacterized protein n=1 Tax=Schizopora paradoxa TaxID=27342 RepID=A0A0H2R5P2_9AGAM|nr:hypothetical protein SCHPADRAFT_894878 [Schizopora paradoxa]